MIYEGILPKHDYVFGKIMEDKETCKRFIEQTLDIKIRDLVYLEKQKTLDPAIDVKGIRLDVYVEDDQNTVYNIEIQSANRGSLPKRSRYYQSVMDVESLNRGSVYQELQKSFVIFVCSFDPFGKKYMKYTFDNRCQEVSNLSFEDGTTKIFLNTKGKIYNVSKELQDALRYLEKPRQDVKAMEIRYQELLQEGRIEGRAEGRNDREMEIVLGMIEEGASDEMILKYLKISKERLEQIKKNQKVHV